MQTISRRGFVISAAAAGAAFGLDGPLELISPACAQGADPATKGFAKFKVGDWNVTTIYDGVWEKAHDPNFVKNASLDDVKAALKAAGSSDALVPVTFTVTIVQKGDQTIMFDSSTGGQTGGPKAGLFVKQNLKAAGIAPDKINAIFVTHYHGDHILGLIEKDTNKLVYPNAAIYVPEAEHKFWMDPALIEKLPQGARPLVQRFQTHLPTWKNVQTIADGAEPLPGIRSINTNGHTAGHTSYELTSGSGRLVVTGDVTNIAALNLVNPGWHLVFDRDAALAEKNRRALFDKAIADGATLTGYHWGMPGAGTIKKDGNGYALVPVTAT